MQVTHKSTLLTILYSLIPVAFLLGCEPKNQDVTPSTPVDISLCSFKTGPCIKTVADVDIELSLNPWQAPSEQPIQITLHTSKPLSNVKVKLQGRDMFMGIIPVNLTQMGENGYNAPLIYGSCSSGYMVWSAVVSFEHNGVESFTTFDFLADNPE